ncbi:BTAD domain-containing putative transcriptional regulator [Kitasatospora sp. NPDC096147]|uniref:BTAD domain-containing putative transcriptional regulator n=1 Tax=Kitasatospora sp. NPDC096147 TaxID=3364093 RepID=UPI00381F03D4
MKFRVLGPLEISDASGPIALGGVKQRATLGFLLLQPNRVVPTSQLLNALWPIDDAPASARKILQNAVWGLRQLLSSGQDDQQQPAALLTQAPGYRLQVAPEAIDLHRYQRQVEEGRAKLAAGEPGRAAGLLREALALWHGAALADLVETGVSWPELTTIQNARLDAMEDCFEAELACGRHHEVLPELEAMATTASLRERSYGQLVLALYRCGRQADALNAYSRLRAALVEELGLEPSRELQALQQAILNHDPGLNLEASETAPALIEHRWAGPEPRAAAPAEEAPPRTAPAPSSPAGPAPDGRAGDGRASEGRASEGRAVTAGREEVSVLIMRTSLDVELHSDTPSDIDEILDDMSWMIQEHVQHFGGVVAASIGSVSLALFKGRQGVGHEEGAVLAAMAIRDGFGAAAGLLAHSSPAGQQPEFHAAVATGGALVRYHPDEPDVPASITGSLLDRCQQLLDLTPDGELWACGTTRRMTGSLVAYGETPVFDDGETSGWLVNGPRRGQLAHDGLPTIERELELDLLRGVLDRTRIRSMPHLVTVLGDRGIGKTKFLTEFQRMVADCPSPVRILASHAPAAGDGSITATQTEILRSYCGITPADSPSTARTKLAEVLDRLVGPAESEWLLPCLSSLVDPAVAALPDGPEAAADAPTASEAWCRLVTEIAITGPLLVVIDDLHNADEALLDLVDRFAEISGPIPLLVVAAAGPELLRRRPGWGGGRRHATTITLEPLSDTAIDRLLDLVLPSSRTSPRNSATWFRKAVRAGTAAVPNDQRRHARTRLRTGVTLEPAPPWPLLVPRAG